MRNDFLSVGQLADSLGVQASTVYGWTHRKQVPFYKVNGKTLLFKQSEINDWIESQKVEPQGAKHD
ncbi:helix-turn-helix domain-containing protein [Spirochaeta dissipatitropha]